MYNDEIPEKVNGNQVNNKQRHFLAVFFISFLWGTFGVDRFYLGKYWTGLLKLITFGGLGLWTLVDLTMVMSGSMRDKNGNEMLEAERYKKFAKRTVSLFTLFVLLFVIISGVTTYYAITQFVQNGGLKSLIPDAGGQTIDINQLKSLNINLQDYIPH